LSARATLGRMTVEDPRSRGTRQRLTDPAGHSYIVQAARSGYVEWPTYARQGVLSWAAHSGGGWLAHRLWFRGGWSVVVWQGDAIAPKRRTMVKRRYRGQAEAVAAMNELAGTIERSGLSTG